MAEDKTSESMADIKAYQTLAADIVKMACVDYVDALIVKTAKEAEIKRWRDKVFALVLEYGRKRYIVRSHQQWILREQKANIKLLNRLRNLLDDEKIEAARDMIIDADAEIRSDLQFFHSGMFDIFMPNTDEDGLIFRLNEKAKRGERVDRSVAQDPRWTRHGKRRKAGRRKK